MKTKIKSIYVYITIALVILVSVFIFSKTNEGLVLTKAEKIFVEENKDTIFLAGYYPTDSEKKFSEKICEKIEEDTGLRISLYEDTWENNLFLLESGSLPIVMNMNKTKERQSYAYFTDTFQPITSGIYSDQSRPIENFSDIIGKTIGVEKDVALLNSFVEEYPNFSYDLIVYDDFELTRDAFHRGDIDGFLSTKSYDNYVKGLYFFGIESISLDTNHIAVSREYPALYGIIEKEVSILKQQNWDSIVADVINFELEKKIINFSKEELVYIEEHEQVVIGLPTEYFLYIYGEDYNPDGALGEVLEKIAFISGTSFVYRFDSLENLRLRNDIDIFFDCSISKAYGTNPIFTDEIIIIGNQNQKTIKEIFELSPYKIGIFGVPDIHANLAKQMPNMAITEFFSYEEVIGSVKEEELDYLIMPQSYFEKSINIEGLVERGSLDDKVGRLVSDDMKYIDIINKCLVIIDTDKIMDQEVVSENSDKANIFFMILLVLFFAILISLKRVYDYLVKIIDINNPYGFHNIRYIQRKIKNKDAGLILVQIEDVNQILHHYGRKLFDKYLRNLQDIIRKELKRGGILVCLNQNHLLLILEAVTPMDEFSNVISSGMDTLINGTILSYNLNISYSDYFKEDDLLTSLDKLNIGLLEAKVSKLDIYVNEQYYQMYRNNIARDYKVKEAIVNQEIKVNYRQILTHSGEEVGVYTSVKLGAIKQKSIYRIAKKLNLEVVLDKMVINSIINGKKAKSNYIMIDLSESTLVSDHFFRWVQEKLNDKEVYIQILISSQVYERNCDILEHNNKIAYALKNFGANIKTDCLSKYHDIKCLWLDSDILNDMDTNKNFISFITEFAKENSMKIMTENQYFKEADYYIEEEIR